MAGGQDGACSVTSTHLCLELLADDLQDLVAALALDLRVLGVDGDAWVRSLPREVQGAVATLVVRPLVLLPVTPRLPVHRLLSGGLLGARERLRRLLGDAAQLQELERARITPREELGAAARLAHGGDGGVCRHRLHLHHLIKCCVGEVATTFAAGEEASVVACILAQIQRAIGGERLEVVERGAAIVEAPAGTPRHAATERTH